MFNFDTALASWRRTMVHNRAFTADDLDELEQHIRDQVAGLQAQGLSDKVAFSQAMREMGDYGTAEAEYRKVYWGKLKRRRQRKDELLWRLSMLKNYLKIAFRNLRKQKGYSFINIAGLAVGLAVCLLVMAFIKDQARYDHFHTHADRIYRVTSEVTPATNSPARRYATTPPPLAPMLRTHFPEVREIVRLKRLTEATSFGDTRFGVNGFYADSSFFRVFSFALARGDTRTALAKPHSIVLSQEAAAKFFGNADPIGQTLQIEQVGDFVVTGIFDDIPQQSHLDFEAVASLSTLTAADALILQDWTHLRYYTYLLLDEHTSPSALASKVPRVVQQYAAVPGTDMPAYHFQALTDINVGPILAREIGTITPRAFAFFLAALAAVILLAACVNYVNLSVARSLRRAKEVGIRKAVGAYPLQIVKQFLSESVTVAGGALALAFLLFYFVLRPQWNSLLLIRNDFGPLSLDFTQDAALYVLFLAFGVLVGLLAGLYPAFYLSSFRPARVLKGVMRTRGASGTTLRSSLIVFQFALSLLFMVSTLLIYRQSEYFLNADFGFAKEHLVNVELHEVPYEAFRDELLRHPDVLGVSATSSLPAVSFQHTTTLRRPGTTDSTVAAPYAVDAHFVDNLGLTQVAGRNFSETFSTDRRQAVLLNETAVRALGFGSPAQAIDHMLSIDEAQTPVQVVGVVQDFQSDFLWNPLDPLVMRYDPAQFRYANVRLRPDDQAGALAHLEATWKRFDPVHPLAYEVFDEQIASQYADFKDFIRIVGLLAGLALFIAGLGLLAMAHHSTEVRLKEIGIRKVLGASVSSLVMLLSKGYLRLVGIALLVGGVLAWFLNTLWLQFFAHRVQIGGDVFLAGTLAVLSLAFVIMGSQTVKAALTDPVKSLRYE